MVLMIVSGRSGSGKSVALRALEDMGFYCVDNLPIILLPNLASSLMPRNTPAAISIDVRNMPRSSRSRADLIINTSEMSVHQLSEMLRVRSLGTKERKLSMVFESFGFKYGLPIYADYVFDVRFLPNPHWDPKLRSMTGLDKPVVDFLKRHSEVHHFIYQTLHYLNQWLPMLENNDRSYLTIAIGCTGGKHRSVYIAEQLADYFRSRGKNVQLRHRTLEKRKE